MPEKPAQVFARLSRTSTPEHPAHLLDTAVVLGGSVAGLLSTSRSWRPSRGAVALRHS